MSNDWRSLIGDVIALQSDEEIKTAPGPSLQWYPQQWLGDPAIQLMGMLARGCHHHLLMIAWKGFDLDDNSVPCSLPNDSDLLKALCQHPEEWASIFAQVERGWKLHEGRLWNLGLCRAYLSQMAKRRTATSSGQAGGKAKAEALRSKSKGKDNDLPPQYIANATEEVANASGEVADVKSQGSSSSSSSGFSLQSSGFTKEEDALAFDEIEESKPGDAAREHHREIKQVLQAMETEVAGFCDGWESWMAALPTAKRKTAWAKVLELRRFVALSKAHSKTEILSFLETSGRREWRSFKKEWWDSDHADNKAGGKPWKRKPSSVPHSIAPNSSGKERGINF